MGSERSKQERRSGKDRRRSVLCYTGVERRSGKDRRQSIEAQLKFLIEQDEKRQAAAKRQKIISGSGNIIRRRKGKEDRRI